MDTESLKKRLDIYKTPAGQIRNMPSEVLIEIAKLWMDFKGSKKEFAEGIGVSSKQLGPTLRAAKNAYRQQGIQGDFEEITLAEVEAAAAPQKNQGNLPSLGGIEFVYDNRMIRFPSVDTLLEFLKKAS